jgi:hypothetical protein
LAIEIFLAALIGFVLGLFGPFGSFAMPLVPRLLYWTLFSVAGYAIFRPLIIVGSWVSEMLRAPALVGIGAALALATLPMTLLVATALNGLALPARMDSESFLILYAQVWLIGFLIYGLFWIAFRNAEPPAAEAQPSPAMPVAAQPQTNQRFEDRLPPGFGPLLALKGEDHYVRAIGEGRDTLILLRLRDAIGELPGGEGLQVHRSWWVARAAVLHVRRDGRSAVITLTNQTEVPVSRENVAIIRQAGWL